MTQNELLNIVQSNSFFATELASVMNTLLEEGRPLPPENCTSVLTLLRKAVCAATELERLARGGDVPKKG